MTKEVAPLGIIAGSGALPGQLIEACRAEGRSPFVLTFEGAADIAAFNDVPHARVRLGVIGEALSHLRTAGVREVVLAGGMKRPSLLSLKPDAAGAKLLAKIGRHFFGGDDALLRALVQFLEEEGFTVIGADTLIKDMLAPAGALGIHQPTPKDLKDIALGMKAAKELGKRDLGQAVIVENGAILGEEDAEGTDALITRCAARKQKSGGVLVKMKKPQQERRADLPSIGPQTIKRAKEAELAGIALEAGGTLVLHKKETIQLADAHGIFIYGVKEREHG